jgi:2-oxoglutarate ferredoxin oxidoreductase subunit alpha
VFQSQGYKLTGAEQRERRVITSLFLKPEELERMNSALQKKDRAVRAHEVRWAEQYTDDAELVVVAFGSAARITQTAIKRARSQGLGVGLFRPISLYPFPDKELARLSERVHKLLVVEMSAGQMVQDVQLAVEGNADVRLLGKMGGLVPMPDEILAEIEQAMPPLAYLSINPDEALMAAFL